MLQVKEAVSRWDGSGSFVFTSSMSVCATEDGSLVTETCPVVPEGKSPSTDRLLGAEQAVLGGQGNVLRLVGLYHATRGPHTFFAKAGEVARYGGYTVNMLHYEDAARLAFAILRGDGAADGKGYRGRVFLGADNHPVTFDDMMAACFGSGVMQGSVKFTGTPETGGLGKKVNNDATRKELGWEPKYSSFREFFYAGAKDLYNSETFQGMGMAHKS
jgi:nucleoside-diphosphate-sugar epimerase